MSSSIVKFNGMSQYSGILGLRGRPPITAVLTTKRKEDFGKKNIPHRFWLVEPRQDDRGIRKLSSVFDFFNNAPESECRSIRGIILHPHMSKCFHSNLLAQKLPAQYYRNRGIQIPVSQTTKGTQTKGHPNDKPSCVGDGRTATRWQGKNADDFEVIKCPNDKCEFRLGRQKWCKPHMTFLFALRWEDPKLPSGIIRFDSASWNTCSNFYGEDEETRDGKTVIVKQGFFGLLDNLAKNAGMNEATTFGVPFVMNLSYESKKDGDTTWVFPVTYIAPEFAMPPVKFFKEMRQDMKLLQDINPITVEEEIAREPSVLDVSGPIAIGSARSENGKPTIIDVEPEPVEENGKAKLYPEKWGTERKKKVPRIKSAWADIAEETLGNNIALNADKDIALAELRFRIKSWQEVYAGLEAADEWEKITVGGDIVAIPELPMKGDPEKTCLASVAAKLLARWSELKAKRKAA